MPEDLRAYLDENLMAPIGRWTLCNDILYSLAPALARGTAPDPETLVLLEGDMEQPVSMADWERALYRPPCPPQAVMEYVAQIPHIFWRTEQERRIRELGERPELRGVYRGAMFDRKAKLRAQYEWMVDLGLGESDDRFQNYLNRLHRVVEWYENQRNIGPALGSPTGAQFIPLHPDLMFGDNEFNGLPHPQQLDRFELLLESEDAT